MWTAQSRKTKGGEGNPEGQVYKLPIADGLCGNTVSARNTIQILIDELLPDDDRRLVYGDLVYDAVNGGLMNMEAIILRLARYICSVIKESIQVQKAFIEDTVNRITMSTTIFAIPDRDGPLRETAAKATTLIQDIWNIAFDSFIDSLCEENGLIVNLLRELTGEKTSDNTDGSSSDTDVGANVRTPILNTSDICITDTIINNIGFEFGNILSQANNEMDEKMSELNLVLLRIFRGQLESVTGGYDPYCGNREMDDVKDTIDRISNGGGGGSSPSMDFGLGEISQFLSFFSDYKFILDPLMNIAGWQEIFNTSLECVGFAEGIYSTATQMEGSWAGLRPDQGTRKEDTFTQKSSKPKGTGVDNIGFGGINGLISEYRTELCESVTLPRPNIPDIGFPVKAISLPSSDPAEARNFRSGIPNNIIVLTDTGIYWNPEEDSDLGFPQYSYLDTMELLSQ